MADTKTPAGTHPAATHPAHPPGSPPSYERSASPAATAPSTVYEGEVDTGPRMIQPDHAYPHGAQNYNSNLHQSPSVSPPPAQGYYASSPLPQGAQNMPQYQHPPPQPQHTGSYQSTQSQPHPQPQPQPQLAQHQQPGHVVGPAGQGQTFKNTTPVFALTGAASPVECPACGARTLTRTNLVVGNTTHAWAAGVCLLTLLGCIPYCVSGTKDVEHKCGNCGVQLATWHRSGRTDVHMHA